MLWARYVLGQLIRPINNLNALLKFKKLRIGYKARIISKSTFEGYNKIERFSVFRGMLGFGSYVGANSLVIGKIGRFCSIADNVKFISATHPVKQFVSTHPAFYSLHKQIGISYVNTQKFNEYPKLEGEEYSIIVGNDVYIGYGVTIIGPVRIGDGAVIAANSTVTKDVEPYSIVGGTPAKELKKRFDEKEIEFLMKFKWWEKDENWWKKNADTFSDIKEFVELNS